MHTHVDSPPEEMLLELAGISIQAGRIVMRYFRNNPSSWMKPDHSPVSEADEACEEFLLEHIARLQPQVPVIAEELSSKGKLSPIENGGRFFLVDPIDGTRGFINHSDEFTINIALIEAGIPRLGVIYAPAKNRLWFAGRAAYACDVQPGDPLPDVADFTRLRTRDFPASGLVILRGERQREQASRPYMAHIQVAKEEIRGSSLKFCYIAQGDADLYIQNGHIMEWDIAAGDAILRAAGGGIIDTITQQLVRYGDDANHFQAPTFAACGKLLRIDSDKIFHINA